MELAMDDTVFAIENEFKMIVEESEAKLRHTLKTYYEKRIDHFDCNQTIANLKKELKILKNGFESMTTLSRKLKTEVDELKMFKSNSEKEMELMAKKLTKRRAECQMLRKDNLELRAQLLTMESAKVEAESPRKLATNTVNGSASDLYKLLNKDSDFYDTSDANRTAENSCDDNEGDESLPIETLYQWFDSTGNKKPKWSRVRVSQRAWDEQGPYSIMHTVDASSELNESKERTAISIPVETKGKFLNKRRRGNATRKN
jgi:hypothetical protein